MEYALCLPRVYSYILMKYKIVYNYIVLKNAPEKDISGGLVVYCIGYDKDSLIGKMKADLIKGMSVYLLPEELRGIKKLKILYVKNK